MTGGVDILLEGVGCIAALMIAAGAALWLGSNW